MHESWDDRLLTGNAPIDEQHRQVFTLMAELRAEGEPVEDANHVRDVLDRLMTYADTHFLMEERLMDAVAYPDPYRADMIDEHRTFVAFARQHVLDYRRGAVMSVRPLLGYLGGWWADHILEQDRRLAEYVQARGADAD